MALLLNTIKRLLHSLADNTAGRDLIDNVNRASALVPSGTAGTMLAAAITATNVSQTVDFGVLAVGDLVVMIPAVAGNSDFIGPIATAGNLGQAAVVGNLYLVLRPVTYPAADATKL